MNRYDAPAGEGEFEPGSEGRVLANKLGVISVEEIDDIELELLEKLYRRIFHERFPERRLQVADLKDWHRQWLGNVYGWAGGRAVSQHGQGRLFICRRESYPGPFWHNSSRPALIDSHLVKASRMPNWSRQSPSLMLNWF